MDQEPREPDDIAIRESILAELRLPDEGEVVLEGGSAIKLCDEDPVCYISPGKYHRSPDGKLLATSQRRTYYGDSNVLVIEVVTTRADTKKGITRDRLWNVVGQGHNPRFTGKEDEGGYLTVDREGLPQLDLVFNAGELEPVDMANLTKLVTDDLRPGKVYESRPVLEYPGHYIITRAVE